MNKQTNLFQKEKLENDDLSLIPVVKKNKIKLTKAQSEFNRLNKEINELKAEIVLIPQKEQKIKVFYDKYAKPLFDKEIASKYDYLIYLDKRYEEGKLSKTDQKTLVDIILHESEGVTDLMNEEQAFIIQPLIYKYEELAFGMTHEELEQEAILEALEFIKLMGFKPNKQMKNAKTEEELFAALSELMKTEVGKMEASEEKKQQKRTTRENNKASQTKEKKMTKAELKKKIEEEQTLKPIREIYLELVKELHPDREMNEELRMLKEERMKQLTEAYKQKDLASLLMMQINWLQEQSEKAPQSQTDEVLKRFNKLLRAQLERLREEFFLICESPLPGVENVYRKLRSAPLEELDFILKDLLFQQKELLESVEEYISRVSTLTGMRAFLRKYRKEQKNESLYDDFF